MRSQSLIKEEIMKKFIAALACLYFTTHMAACTSKSASSDDEAPADQSAAEGTEAKDGSDALSAESQGGDGANAKNDAATAEDKSADSFLDEQLPSDDLGETKPAENAGATPAEQKPADGQAAADQKAAPAEQSPGTEQPPAAPADTAAPPPAFDSGPVAVDPGSQTQNADQYSPPAEPVAEAPKQSTPLVKVQSAPFHGGGQLLNAVYISRPGDNFKKVSTMIYGSADHEKELKKANSWMKKVKPGNKIYYNSPKRPTDDTRMLTYYEDMGIQPQTYVAKNGESLRKVSKTLLGYPEAWKEIWVTNPVESKGELSEGTELRYWLGDTGGALAAATPAPAPAHEELPPPPQVPAATAAVTAPPPPAMNELPPPPPPMPAAPEIAPPPPPPPMPAPIAKKKVEKPHQQDETMLSDDMIMALAGAGILVAGLAAVIVIRKRKAQKEMAEAFGDTHVGS